MYSWSTLLWYRCYFPHQLKDSMSPVCGIFILGLADPYTGEKLFQIRPTEGNSTAEFHVLVKAASEIQQAKDNCLEAGNTSVCGVTGSGYSGAKSKKPCLHCNTMSHNERGMGMGARKNTLKH